MSPAPETNRLLIPGSEEVTGQHGPPKLLRYILWRVAGSIVIVFLTLTVVFYALEVAPPIPTFAVPTRGCAPGDSSGPCAPLPGLINQWGLDKPVWDRYVTFLTNILTGNLGVSITKPGPGIPVWDIIASAAPRTLAFVGVTMVLLALLSLPPGIRMSRQKGGLLDTIASLLLALPFAVPAVMLGLLAVYVFAYLFKVFPLPGTLQLSADPLIQLANELRLYVLPELVILGTTVGLFTWVVRDHPLRPEAELRPMPYGDWRSPKQALHARLAGAIPRFLATVPILFPWTLGVVMLGEVIFDIPGAGLLVWTAFQNQNYPLLTGVVLVISLLVMIPVLIVADILHYWMTARWDRVDAVGVDDFRVDARDPLRGLGRVLRSAFGLVGLVLILALVIVSAAAPLLVGPYPTLVGGAQPLMPPSPTHLLGTDRYGRDLLALLVYGGQPAIGIAILAFALALMAELGVMAGIGFFGERAAVFLVLPVDLFLVISIPFAILLSATVGPNAAAGAPALVGWPIATRMLLLETTGMAPASRERPGPRLSVRERENRSLNLVWGTGPLILGDALLAASLSILASASLSFFGLGAVGTRTVEGWGQIAYEAYTGSALLGGFWWYLVFPIVWIVLAVLGPTLLSLQLKRIPWHRPRNVIRVEAPPPIVSVLPPGQGR